jgi:hypothetical protein
LRLESRIFHFYADSFGPTSHAYRAFPNKYRNCIDNQEYDGLNTPVVDLGAYFCERVAGMDISKTAETVEKVHELQKLLAGGQEEEMLYFPEDHPRNRRRTSQLSCSKKKKKKKKPT